MVLPLLADVGNVEEEGKKNSSCLLPHSAGVDAGETRSNSHTDGMRKRRGGKHHCVTLSYFMAKIDQRDPEGG